MRALIEKLESASSGNRDLDCRIFEGVCFPAALMGHAIESFSRSWGGTYTVNTRDGYRHIEAFHAPAFTTATDVALALVPEGWGCRLTFAPQIKAELWSPDGSPLSARTVIPAFAATPALALCIAALKARLS